MAHVILAETTASVSELKKNPMGTVAAGEGFPVAILNRNEPAFYCIPASAYEALMDKLVKLAAEDGPRRPALIAERARAEKALYRDERWRPSFQQAITAAENASSMTRRDIGGSLVSILIRIETGLPMLD